MSDLNNKTQRLLRRNGPTTCAKEGKERGLPVPNSSRACRRALRQDSQHHRRAEEVSRPRLFGQGTGQGVADEHRLPFSRRELALWHELLVPAQRVSCKRSMHLLTDKRYNDKNVEESVQWWASPTDSRSTRPFTKTWRNAQRLQEETCRTQEMTSTRTAGTHSPTTDKPARATTATATDSPPWERVPRPPGHHSETNLIPLPPMKKQLITAAVAVSLLTACGSKSNTSESSQTNKFDYTVEQFADLQILRYRVPGFEELTLRQKQLVYYLTEAALQGRDILFDQNGKYNLTIRRTLEAIYTGYQGDRTTPDFKAFEVYLKRVWFSNGIHHHYGSEKFVPRLQPRLLPPGPCSDSPRRPYPWPRDRQPSSCATKSVPSSSTPPCCPSASTRPTAKTSYSPRPATTTTE